MIKDISKYLVPVMVGITLIVLLSECCNYIKLKDHENGFIVIQADTVEYLLWSNDSLRVKEWQKLIDNIKSADNPYIVR